MASCSVEHNGWQPTWGLRNGHMQSILSASLIRKPLVRWRAREVMHRSQTMQFRCSDGVRMHGLLSQHGDQSRPLVAFIHGWEGCADSLYLLSMAAHLYARGYDIFRLHLRDHGPTHGLNPELFHACRLNEVGEALAAMQQRVKPVSWSLVGFSLGGNFSLRVGAHAREFALTLDQVIAVSALINGQSTLFALLQGYPWYRDYFVRRWRRSLRKKAKSFPQQVDLEAFLAAGDLAAMTEYFVKHHTEYASTAAYFSNYALTANHFAGLDVPAWLIVSEDDPVIPVEELSGLGHHPLLNVVRSKFGGHCGFIENYRLESWIDRFVADILMKKATNKARQSA